MSSATPPDPLVGRTLDGRYRIEARLGEGGLGVVYRAVHERLGRPFAVKVLQPEYAQNPALRARFEREARALGALSHPNVVAVTDFGIDGEVPYLVMELLEGRSLEDAIATGLPPEKGIAIARDIVAAVAYAHGLGLVHRDLKPANVFLQRVPDAGEVVRVLDFGLAKFLDAGAESALTKAGTAMGTPAYMSPEQAMGGAASPKNDVYSLGILLYEILAGERPFRGKGGELMRQHLLEPLPSLLLARPDVPAVAQVTPVVERAASKTPAERFPDAGELRVALERALDGSIKIDSIRALAQPLSNASETVRDSSTSPPRTSGASRERTSAGGGSAGADSATTDSAVSTGARSGAASAATLGAQEPAAEGGRFPVLALLPLIILLPGVLAALYTFYGSHSAAGGAPGGGEGGAETAPGAGAADASAPRVGPAAGSGEAVDPWSAPVPPALATLRARVARGQPLDAAEQATLRREARDAPGDPRPWLLWGHAEFLEGQRTDAMTRYERAMEASPTARHDPDMLRNLVTMSFHRTVGERARDLVASIYGREALPAIAAARAPLTDADEIAALDRLTRRLAAGGNGGVAGAGGGSGAMPTGGSGP